MAKFAGVKRKNADTQWAFSFRWSLAAIHDNLALNHAFDLLDIVPDN